MLLPKGNLSRPSDQKGVGMAEYTLILSLVAIAAIAVMNLHGSGLKCTFGTILRAFSPSTNIAAYCPTGGGGGYGG